MTFDASEFIVGESLRDRCTSLLRGLNFSEEFCEELSYRESGEIFDNDLQRVIGTYRMVDDGLPVIGFHAHMRTNYAMSQRLIKGVPRFFPTMCQRTEIGIEIREHHATPELHEFLMGELLTLYDGKPGYKIRENSKPFFQGGAHDPHGQWFYIEFLGRTDIYKTVRWINEHFRQPGASQNGANAQ